MKQCALHQFSARLSKQSTALLHRCLWLMTGISGAVLSLRTGTALLLCLYTPEAWLSAAWFAYALFGLALTSTSGWLVSRVRSTLYQNCTERVPLPCADHRTILHRMYGLTLLAAGMRGLLGIGLLGGLYGSGFLLYEASIHPEDCMYYLMGAMQILPLTVGLLVIRIRWYILIQAAYVLSTQAAVTGTWDALRTARRMLAGEYFLLVRIVLRSLPQIVIPFLLPRYILTLHVYFSVRSLEWRYAQEERSISAHDRTGIYRRHNGDHAAGAVSAP